MSAGHSVKAVDNLSTGNKENVAHLSGQKNFGLLIGTVCNQEFMRPSVKWADRVYHLAAPVGVKLIMQQPVATILDNLRGIDVIMELAQLYRKKIFIASTSEVYGKSMDFAISDSPGALKETDYRVIGNAWNHRWAYANSKSMDEFLGLAYFKEFKLPVVIGRFFNTVGPRQTHEYGMVVPGFIQSALKGEPIMVYGDGNQSRTFLHVKDCVNAVTRLMDTPAAEGDIFNIGNPEEITILNLAKKVKALTGSASEIRFTSYEQAYGSGFEDMNRRTPDISKLKKTIGFDLQYDLEGILKDVIVYCRKLIPAQEKQ